MLGAEFSVVGRWPLPSIREVFSEVRREESRRKVMLREHITSGLEALALVTRGLHVGFGPRQSKRTYCGLVRKRATLKTLAGLEA